MGLLKKLFSKKEWKKTEQENKEEKQPQLAKAISYKENDIGKVEWNTKHNDDFLIFSNENKTMHWNPKAENATFLPATTSLHLHSWEYLLDFKIEKMWNRQIAVGFMLLWDNWLLDRGLYWYLWAWWSAWAYDPSTGDVVSATQSIQWWLPKFEDWDSWTITIELNIPRDWEWTGRFIVNGIKSWLIRLPIWSVIVPAACLLKKEQKITIENFKKI